jgi:hypothetical protein
MDSSKTEDCLRLHLKLRWLFVVCYFTQILLRFSSWRIACFGSRYVPSYRPGAPFRCRKSQGNCRQRFLFSCASVSALGSGRMGQWCLGARTVETGSGSRDPFDRGSCRALLPLSSRTGSVLSILDQQAPSRRAGTASTSRVAPAFLAAEWSD